MSSGSALAASWTWLGPKVMQLFYRAFREKPFILAVFFSRSKGFQQVVFMGPSKQPTPTGFHGNTLTLSEYDWVALNAQKKAGLLLLALDAGLALGQPACSSQTAIAITTIDGAAQADSAVATDRAVPRTETTPDTPARPESGPEAGPEAGPETGPDLLTASDAVTSFPRILFSDGFDSGFEINWLLSESSDGPIANTMSGTNEFVTLDSTQADFTRLRCNLDGDKFKDVNVTASMKIRVEQAPTSTRTIRLDIRQAATTANIFYAVGATIANDGTMTKVSVFKKVDDGAGNYTICELAAGAPFATPVAMNQWRTIKLTISGTTNVQLVAYFETLAMATYTDDCVSPLTATNGATVPNGGCLADQWGLGIQVEKGIKASVDDVLVTTP